MNVDVQKLLDGLREMKADRYAQARDTTGMAQVQLWAEADLIDALRTLIESCVVKP